MKIYEILQNIEESVSSEVYYFRNLNGALNIINSNKINLAAFTDEKTSETALRSRQKFYYMSTSRIKFGGYSRNSFYHKNGAATFVLNGNALNQNFHSKPVDYWGKKMRNVEPYDNSKEEMDRKKEIEMKYNENEDRIFSDKPNITPLKRYVNSIHLYVPNYYIEEKTKEDYEIIRKVDEACLKARHLGIDIFLYDKPSDFKVLRNGKKPDIGEYHTILSDFVKMANSGVYVKNNQFNEINRYIREMNYEGSHPEYGRVVLKDLAKRLSYNMGGKKESERHQLEEFVATMKKFKTRNVMDFVVKVAEKVRQNEPK